MTHAVFAAGGPAPELLGVVTLDGRFSIVLPGLDGPTLLQLTRTGAMTRGRAGAILADLGLAVHKTPPPPDVLTLCVRHQRHASEPHRQRRPRPTSFATSCRPSSATGARSGRSGSRRRSGAAARGQCGLAVRVCAAGRHLPHDADGGDRLLPADRPRLGPPRGCVSCPPGAADPARRRSPVLGRTDSQRWRGLSGGGVGRSTGICRGQKRHSPSRCPRRGGRIL
jgi:hypothetical protein